MASHKIHIGLIRNCPPLEQVAPLLAAHGWPDDSRVGLIDSDANTKSAGATYVENGSKKLQHINRETGAMEQTEGRHDKLIPFAIFPMPDGMGVVEAYGGGAKAIEIINEFLVTQVGLEIVVERVTVDPVECINRLEAVADNMTVVKASLDKYGDDDARGKFNPKFSNNLIARGKIGQSAVEDVKSVQCKFNGPNGKINLTICGSGSFRFSCKPDDADFVSDIIRQMAGVPRQHANSVFAGAS